jgi:hypothetical protein
MINWIKKILKIGTKSCAIQNVTPRYESVIIDKGNGEWYHPSSKNPLHHNWIIFDNVARCTDCEQKVIRRIINEG